MINVILTKVIIYIENLYYIYHISLNYFINNIKYYQLKFNSLFEFGSKKLF